MKVNGISLGFALFLTGLLTINLDSYWEQSITGTLIVFSIMAGCWFFAFDNESELNLRLKENE